MNLVDINLKNQNITNNELQISKIKMKDGKYILGFRAEDARIEENGNFSGSHIYSIEHLGDVTLVTFKLKII